MWFWILNGQAAVPPPIINGQTEAGFESAVAIGTTFGENQISVCSGTLITPRVILTAAHCGSDLPLELVTSLGIVFFGADISDADAEIRLEDYRVHPDYVPLQNGVTNGENDVGVLVLEEDAPVEAAWLRLDPFTDDEVEDETVVSVGFGLNETGSSDGLKRSAELTIDTMDEMFLVSRSRSNPNEANICSGDSGGPQFYVDDDGRHIIWGVHSWGDSQCENSSGSTRLDVVSDWVVEQVLDIHGTDDFCEATGRYDDGVCSESDCPADPDCIDDSKDVESASGCQSVPATPSLWALLALGCMMVLRANRRAVSS